MTLPTVGRARQPRQRELGERVTVVLRVLVEPLDDVELLVAGELRRPSGPTPRGASPRGGSCPAGTCR